LYRKVTAYKQKERAGKVETSNKETRQIKTQPIEILKAKEFLTVRDVATLLNSSIRTVYRLIEQGNIKAVNIAQRKTLVKRSDLDKLFKEPTNRTQPEGIPETQKQELNEWVQAGGFNISECYNLTEVQDKYGISETALQNLIKRNSIPKIKKGWFAYVPKVVIDKLLS
jgi:excisionase family DNA binding protein